MLIGVPKEIKDQEHRIGLTPAAVRELIAHNHQVIIEDNGGAMIGFSNDMYQAAGAKIVPSAAAVFASAELIVKVKEPQPEECALLSPEQTLFTFLHLAPDRRQTQCLLESGATCIAYETVTDDHGGLPLLTPMSEVAGRLSIQKALPCLETAQGGKGLLLGGVPGVAAARVVVIGAGVVGLHAARMALGLGAKITMLDRSLARLRYIDELFGNHIQTLFSTTETIEQQLRHADVVIGAVLIPGAATPKLVTRDMLQVMQPRSVLVDVAIDQGGCFATSKPTSHQNPTYVVDDIIHYCVTNIPGSVARTATFALTNATLPYILKLADNGVKTALNKDPHLRQGLNICRGMVCCEAVATALDYEYVDPLTALQQH